MMDEYIPSPRHNPNKPRRMRDVSSIYPVNEKQLLLEAIMKQQRESPSCEVASNADPLAIVEDSDVDIPPLPPSSPGSHPSLWRDKRTCPVCHWTGGSSSSSSSGTSEYDGDESDASSACKDCKSPCVLAGGASSSSSEDDDEDNEIDVKEDSLDDGGIDEDEEEEEEDVGGEVEEDEDSGVKIEDEDKQRGPTTRYFGEQGYDAIRKGVRLPKTLERGHCLLGREVLTAPGKLLYGRHSVYYRGAALFHPQGMK